MLRISARNSTPTIGHGARAPGLRRSAALMRTCCAKPSERAKHAEASAEIEREAREKAEADVEKLKEQLAKQKRQGLLASPRSNCSAACCPARP